jgi:hypothetical protein
MAECSDNINDWLFSLSLQRYDNAGLIGWKQYEEKTDFSPIVKRRKKTAVRCHSPIDIERDSLEIRLAMLENRD